MKLLAQIGGALVIAATGVAAAIYLSKKLFKGIQAIALLGEMLPILKDFTEAFKNNPDVFATLAGIGKEFTPDSGTSLRDVVDRLEAAAAAQAILSGELIVDRQVESKLDIQSREQLARILKELARLGVRVEQGAASGLKAEETAREVKSDLIGSQHRADRVDSAEPGAAADAAAQTGNPQ